MFQCYFSVITAKKLLESLFLGFKRVDEEIIRELRGISWTETILAFSTHFNLICQAARYAHSSPYAFLHLREIVFFFAVQAPKVENDSGVES